MNLSEYSPEEIMRISDAVCKIFSEPDRSNYLKLLREAYVESRKRERDEKQRLDDDARMERISALYDEPSIFDRRDDQVDCHVCDGKGEYCGRTGWRTCGHCYGKGYL